MSFRNPIMITLPSWQVLLLLLGNIFFGVYFLTSYGQACG